MYSKEEIIGEIKRVAEKLGVQTFTRKEFEQNTTIPSHTLSYHLGSWSRALKEAGLSPEDSGDTKNGLEPKDDDELLLELLRIHQETGETPTAALVDSMGKYKYRHYGARWKSIGEAFMMAKDKFPAKPRTIPSSSSSSASSSALSESSSSVFDEPLDLSGLTVEYGRTVKKAKPAAPDIADSGALEDHAETMPQEPKESKTQSSIVEIPVAVEGTGDLLEDAGGDNKMIDKQSIKLIPKTIKPKIAKKKPKFLGEPIRFRGLKFAPVNETGVAFLFGMVGHELGFVVEALRTESPDCEGKRCLDTSDDHWEQVKIDFKYKSSDFQKYDINENESDLVVCWIHDWEDCPIEVLELQAVIKLLDQ